jgi:PAS domain S-box-containing protein
MEQAAAEVSPEPRWMRVLVVDDDEFDRLAVRRCLHESGLAAAVDEAATAAEAMARIGSGAYDCVLLDYYMPGVDSVALLRQIQAAADVPVVIFTGRGGEDVAVEFMKAGAADYLPKSSLTPERLATSFRHAVEMSRVASDRRRAEEQLREQESRFRTLANAVPQLAWITDAEGAIHWYNQRWYDYTGTTLEDMQGWGWQKVLHPDHVQRVVKGIRRCFEAGEPWEDTFPLRRADGEYRWFLSRAVPMRRSDGTLSGWFGTNTDVTEQIETERMLRQREAEFRTLANAIPQLVWIGDSEGRRYWYNDRWYEFTGLRPDQCLGLGWTLVHHPGRRSRVYEDQRAAFRRGEQWEATVLLRRADGEYRSFLSCAMPITDDSGHILRWFGTNTDITERVEAQEALAASEERFRRALEIETVGVMFFTTEGKITGANDAFVRMAGYTREDVNAGLLRWDELTPPEFMPHSLRAAEEFKATGRTTPYEKQYIRKDGSRWWALLAATRVNASEGVEFVLDVSPQKAAELELQRSLASERSARLEAEKATHLRDEVLAILAHDLRNPINTILSAASLLAHTSEDGSIMKPLVVIERATRGMERLVNDLLDIARIEAGNFVLRTDVTDIAALIREAVELFEPQALAGNTALRVLVDEDLPPIRVDKDRVQQVLANLLSNALKFTHAGTTITARATRYDGGVHVSIKDSGVGIPAEHLEHVFDRFWQADRSSRSGAGLGLAICKAIVEAHGGRIWAASAVGRGTTIHFEIPETAPPFRD